MKRQKLIISVITLALITGTALLLAEVPQKLGAPGVKASAVPGSQRWRIDLPETVLGCPSTNLQVDQKSMEMLPPDTSFAQREYYKPGWPWITASVVMMGTDRTSIHKAEYCLQGQGMHVDRMTQETVPMYEPQSYKLPVIKIVASGTITQHGTNVNVRCVYVYWYVADNALSNDHTGFGRMWSMTKQLVFTGVLQRWAYVRFFSYCLPGQEDETYARIKEMIAAAVPQFQTMPKPSSDAADALPQP